MTDLLTGDFIWWMLLLLKLSVSIMRMNQTNSAGEFPFAVQLNVETSITHHLRGTGSLVIHAALTERKYEQLPKNGVLRSQDVHQAKTPKRCNNSDDQIPQNSRYKRRPAWPYQISVHLFNRGQKSRPSGGHRGTFFR